MTWDYLVDESAKSRYDMILGRYILIEIGLDIKLSEHIIGADDELLKWSTVSMIDLGMYEFKYLNTGKI